MENCIFCKIAVGDVGTPFLYEDVDCVAFNDIDPKSPTHILIVSRRHIGSVVDMSESDVDLLGRMVFASKLIANKLGLPGYRLQINVGEAGGQEVFHIHIHLMSN
jgi:histidine triad (HIT) family protein